MQSETTAWFWMNLLNSMMKMIAVASGCREMPSQGLARQTILQ